MINWKKLVRRQDKFVNVLNYNLFGVLTCQNILSTQTVLWHECVGIWKVKGSPPTKFKNY